MYRHASSPYALRPRLYRNGTRKKNWDIIVLLTQKIVMRANLTLDDKLIAKAQALTGLSELSSLIEEALRTLIERQNLGQLARLGGSEPTLKVPNRRAVKS